MISFTGRETMLTAGLEKAATKHKFFKADAPIADVVAKEVKEVKNPAVESYINAHKPISSASSSLAQDSAVSGDSINFFG